MKYLNYLILPFLCFFNLFNIISQSSGDQYILSTSGEDAIMSNGHQVTWTIGEMVTLTGDLPNETYTQGFHQPNISVTFIEDIQINFSVNIFPNPVTDIVTIKLENQEKGYRLKLFDLAGKLILDDSINSNEILIPFSAYSTGVYFLVFTDRKNKKLKTYKIQKSH